MVKRRLAVTGIGIVSPIGSTLETVWENLREGNSGIERIEWLKEKGYACQIGGQVKGLNEKLFSSRDRKRLDPYAMYAVAATASALKDSGIDLARENPDRIGVISSTGAGGLKTIEKSILRLNKKGPGSTPVTGIPKFIPNMAAGEIARRYHVHGPNYDVTTACATWGHSVSSAGRIIRGNEADIVLVGASSAVISDIGIDGFGEMRALSKRNNAPKEASRPFDLYRDGFVLSEGSVMIVLEEMERAKKRGANIYAEIAGWGNTGDGHHFSEPVETGEYAAKAMGLAMERAELNPEDISYISAHGTSTGKGDIAETKAIRLAFGEHAYNVRVSAGKSVHGHLMAAAGGMGFYAAVMAMKYNIVPPTINLKNKDHLCGNLNFVPNIAQKTKNLEACLIDMFGFHGQNCCLAVKKV